MAQSHARIPTAHAVRQAIQVNQYLQEGLTNRAISKRMSVSAVRVSQIRTSLPDLEPWLGQPDPLIELRSRRAQLHRLRTEALGLAIEVRKLITEIDDTGESVQIDRVLGFRS